MVECRSRLNHVFNDLLERFAGLKHDNNEGSFQVLLILDQEVFKKLELAMTDGAHKHALFEFASDSLWANKILICLDRHNWKVDSVLGANVVNLLIDLVVLSAFERNRSRQENFLALNIKLIVRDVVELVTNVLDFLVCLVLVLSNVVCKGVDVWRIGAEKDIIVVS